MEIINVEKYYDGRNKPPYNNLQSSKIVKNHKITLATISFDAVDTSLEPYIDWDVQINKRTNQYVYFYWDNGSKGVEIQKRPKNLFKNFRQVV
jgi:hypothetical protein